MGSYVPPKFTTDDLKWHIYPSTKSLTLFQARSGITLPGQTGQILPTYTFNHINQLNDFVVPKTYSLINVLTFRWP